MISMPVLFGVLALVAAGFVVYFLIVLKDKRKDKPEDPKPEQPKPEQKPKDGPGPWRPS